MWFMYKNKSYGLPLILHARIGCKVAASIWANDAQYSRVLSDPAGCVRLIWNLCCNGDFFVILSLPERSKYRDFHTSSLRVTFECNKSFAIPFRASVTSLSSNIVYEPVHIIYAQIHTWTPHLPSRDT